MAPNYRVLYERVNEELITLRSLCENQQQLIANQTAIINKCEEASKGSDELISLGQKRFETAEAQIQALTSQIANQEKINLLLKEILRRAKEQIKELGGDASFLEEVLQLDHST